MSYQSTILADNPKRYYRGSTTDSSSSAQNAAQTGTVVPGAALLVGDPQTSSNFNGLGYYTSPTTGLATGSSPWSLECWFTVPSLASLNFDTIMDIGTRVTNEEASIYIDTTASPLISLGTFNGITLFGPGLVANTIYYTCASYDGTTLFFDVYNVSSKAHNTYNHALTANIVYGAFTLGDYGTHGLPFHGNIQEMAFYNACLTPTQINRHIIAGTSVARIMDGYGGVFS